MTIERLAFRFRRVHDEQICDVKLSFDSLETLLARGREPSSGLESKDRVRKNGLAFSSSFAKWN